MPGLITDFLNDPSPVPTECVALPLLEHRNLHLTVSHPLQRLCVYYRDLFSQGIPCLARNTHCPYTPAWARESERKVELGYGGGGVQCSEAPGGAGWKRTEMECKCGPLLPHSGCGTPESPIILNPNQDFCLSRKKDRTYLRIYWLYTQHLNILTYSMRASICTLSLRLTNIRTSLHKNELRNSYVRKRN